MAIDAKLVGISTSTADSERPFVLHVKLGDLDHVVKQPVSAEEFLAKFSTWIRDNPDKLSAMLETHPIDLTVTMV